MSRQCLTPSERRGLTWGASIECLHANAPSFGELGVPSPRVFRLTPRHCDTRTNEPPTPRGVGEGDKGRAARRQDRRRPALACAGWASPSASQYTWWARRYQPSASAARRFARWTCPNPARHRTTGRANLCGWGSMKHIRACHGSPKLLSPNPEVKSEEESWRWKRGAVETSFIQSFKYQASAQNRRHSKFEKKTGYQKKHQKKVKSRKL